MTKTRPTASHTGAQVIAADPTQSVWVSANAGTGKTHVLIERILRLLLAGTAPGKILCLTYTKAATAEAANRLSGRLGHWAAAKDGDLADDLLNLLGRAPSDAETKRARVLFATTLEAPEGVIIRTIHSFCESLLGRFPVEAGIAPHFSVIDDGLAKEILAESEARLIADQKRTPAPVLKALAFLAGLVNQDGFRKLMKELNSKRGRLRQMFRVEGGVTGIMARVKTEMGLDTHDTAARVLDQATADAAIDRTGLARAADALDQGLDSDQKRAAAIRAWLALATAGRAEAFLDEYAPVFATQKETAKKTIITKKAKEADPGAFDILMAEQERVVAALGKLRSVRIADATEALLTLGEKLIGDYEDAKRARALLDYDDLIGKAAKLLDDEKGVSWVHYKLDGGIDHILVDEAQDTGPDSWDVIWRLSGDFYSGEGAGEDDRPLKRTVFSVGDEKQSIYSFQGAAPARFGIMRDRYHDRIAAAGSRLQDVALALSYRSISAVLRSVDHVFAQPEAADGLTWDDKALRHDSNRPGQGGLVELWPTLTPDEEPQRLPWDAPVDQTSPDSPEARLAERIADTIKGWRREGEILESAGRPITPGDILILVRTRGTFADRMVKALERRGIGVTGRDRLKLMDHLAVMDLVAAGHFALLPDDDLNTATVLKGPFVEFGDDTLFDLAHGRKEALWRVLQKRRDEKTEFADAWETLSQLLSLADTTPPYEFYARLLGPGGGRRDLIAHLGPEAGEPIDEFLSLSLDFERDHQPSLQGFLHWLESGETEVKREMESGRDEVRVLTVHGAKGLEAPIVFLPDTCSLPLAQLDNQLQWKIDGGQEGDGGGFVVWRMRKDDEDGLAHSLHEAARDETMREHRRLLYVAMTRARDRLYIGGWEGKRKRPEGCWYDLIAPVVEGKGKEITLAGGEKVWRVQDKQKEKPDGKAVAAPASGEEALPDWALAPPPPEPEPSRPLAPSRPSGEEPPIISPLENDDGARFKRGLLVHRLLQSLPDLPAKEREDAARKFLSRPALGLASGERDNILSETLGVMDHPDLANLFGPDSLAEVPLTGVISGVNGGKSRVLSGQVDRLLVTGDAVTVIDYKTNRPPPQTEDAVDPVYLRQMAAYRQVLREIYPGRPVRAVLLWTVGPRMMALGDDILDAHAP